MKPLGYDTHRGTEAQRTKSKKEYSNVLESFTNAEAAEP